MTTVSGSRTDRRSVTATNAPRKVSAGEAAVALRETLRAAFPQTRFLIAVHRPKPRTRVGLRSSWLSVTWSGGPSVHDVGELTRRFEGMRYFPKQRRRRRRLVRGPDGLQQFYECAVVVLHRTADR